jgi:D-amino-acid dehydrogenase
MSTGTKEPQRIAVIGAGIIGVAIAFELQRRGRSALLIDRSEPGRGASYGNLASIAITEFMPASRPSVWARMPGWLLDPEGPIRLRPSYLPRLTPWFLRFLATSRPSRVRQIEAAGAILCQRVYDDLLPMLAAAGLNNVLSAEGCLSLYADDAEFAADREHIEVLRRFGFVHEIVDGAALRDLEPVITAKIHRAVLFPENRSVRDPFGLVTALFESFIAKGGQFELGAAEGFERSGSGIAAIRMAGGRRKSCSARAPIPERFRANLANRCRWRQSAAITRRSWRRASV